MKYKEESWDVDDILGDNTSVFVVKNMSKNKLLYAMSAVYHYIIQFNNDDTNYDLLFYAEPEAEPKNQFFIFTTLPYDFFLHFNPEFNLG